jgi:hypothetical protein
MENARFSPRIGHTCGMSLSLITPDFEEHARLLNDLPFSEKAHRFYEMMSGALMWEDEKANLPFSELGWFRAALAYRSSIIFDKPRTEFEPIWIALKRVAPKSPGFRSERCTPSPELVDCLNQEKRKSKRSLDRLDAASFSREAKTMANFYRNAFSACASASI